ncbi:peptidase M50 [Cryptosporidium xiaoi]|uniref:Peptidase M50 n=1 Tax=Cryptosporidium xiaoi TaxID=659607 RepID=A0AAV9Y2F1_9CRYT
MSEYFRTYVAYRLITDNIEEKNRLKSFLSLNPMLLLSSIDYISLTMMLATFVLLGMPMLSVNQTVKYEKLNQNWKRSIVALSGPFLFLLLGGIFGIIYNIEVLCSNLHHFEGSISQALYLGARLLAFLTIINVLPFPPITDGFMATSPYLPDWVNLEISNARNTILFLILCTLLFIFIAQSKLVADIVDVVVSNLYMIKI